MGCLVRLFAGLLMLGLGGALAYFVPPYMQQATQETISVPDVSKKSLKSAKTGDPMIVSGKISKSNKKHEHGIVVGARYEREVATNSDSDGVEHVWSVAKQFRPLVMAVDVKGIGSVAVAVDDIEISGDVYEKKKGADLKWSGLRRGDKVTVPAVLTSKKPPEFKQRTGYPMSASTSAAWRSGQKQTSELTAWIIYAIAGVFALGGAVTFLTAPFKRKS